METRKAIVIIKEPKTKGENRLLTFDEYYSLSQLRHAVKKLYPEYVIVQVYTYIIVVNTNADGVRIGDCRLLLDCKDLLFPLV